MATYVFIIVIFLGLAFMLGTVILGTGNANNEENGAFQDAIFKILIGVIVLLIWALR